MSKAILILDKPTCCKTCALISTVLSPIYNEWRETCHITQKRLSNLEQIDNQCPLYVLADMRGEE